MKKIITFAYAILIAISTNIFANDAWKKSDVLQITISLNQSFFNKCISQAEYDSTVDLWKCSVLNIPNHHIILNGFEVTSAVNFLTAWSKSACTLKEMPALQEKYDHMKIELYFKPECLKLMSEKVTNLGDASMFKNRKLYIIKQ